MGMFGRLVGWFQGRGGVPPTAPAQGAPDPVRAMGAAALARGNHAEAERFDPRDDDKWPLPSRQDLQRERVELKGVSGRVAALHAALSEGDHWWGNASGKAEAALMALHEDPELRAALEARGMTLGDGGDLTGGSYADMADRMTLNSMERAASEAARGVVREEMEAEEEYLDAVDDRDTGYGHPVGEATKDAPTPTIDGIVQRGLERMTRLVPDIPAADLLAQAQEKRSEAAVEGGWDNYSTAANLRGQADRYELAAAMRDPEAPQGPIARARESITLRLHDRAADVRDDQDVGEDTLMARLRADHALGEIGEEEMAAVIDELEATGRLGPEAAADLKAWHLDRQAERDEDEHEL